MRLPLSATLFAVVVFSGWAAEPATPNTWVKLCEEDSGAREWPAFWYDVQSKHFITSAGMGAGKLHFDTEAFDAATAAWTNLYPEGAQYKVERGPTDAPDANIKTVEPPLKPDANGIMRVKRAYNPYCQDSNVFYQFARSDDGSVYAYLMETTMRFDPAKRAWTDLKAKPYSKCPGSCLIYGALAYDPVNNEIVSIGGTSDEDGGSPGTWAFVIASNEWKKLAQGSAERKALNAQARALYCRAAAFINACRNRFYVTESESEAKQDLPAQANELATAVSAFEDALRSAKLAEANTTLKEALAALAPVAAGFKAMAAKLNGRIASETLVSAQALQDALLAARRALDTEPCGRAVSPMATCGAIGKIVLFGGCTMDGFLADTWVYDCKTRTWEQRFPKIAPAPRGGHVLAWLPKSGKVVLYGSQIFSNSYGIPHQKPGAPQDVWTYDVETNEWKLLAGAMPAGPTGGVGTANSDDLLVVACRDPKKGERRVTWGMRVDPSAPDAGSASAGVAPGTLSLSFEGPADYDKVTQPDPDGVAAFLAKVPSNQWTPMPKPPRGSNPRGWGTRPYDTIRHQFLTFGGGHGAQHYTDVAHYSMRTATWSSGYAEEFPFVNAPFSAMFTQTFWNRPTMGHVWDGADFDPVSGKVIFVRRGATRVYDPATREWSYPPGPMPKGSWKETQYAVTSTPKGAVCWVDNDLYLFDVGANAWSKLPVNGGKVGGAYGDSGGICYDSKRDCLWLAHNGSPVVRYDMKTGNAETYATPPSPEFIWMRETVYVPELDMLLNAGRTTGADGAYGNLAFDIEQKKWVAVVLSCGDGKPRLNDKPYSQIDLGLAYDPGLKLGVFYYPGAQEVLVARLTRDGLKTFEPKIQEPKKK